MLTVRFFAKLREAAGMGDFTLGLPPGVATVAALREHLRSLDPRFAGALADAQGLRAAVNQGMAGPDTEVRDGDEVAFFPPVTGG